MMVQKEALRRQICCGQSEQLGSFNSNSIRDSEMGEFYEEMRDKSNTTSRLSIAYEYLSQRPAPTPTANDKARIGHLVGIEYDDESGKTTLVEYVLGGENEPDIFAEGLHINYRAPLGHKIIGKGVGDDVVLTINGKTYDGEIVSIRVPALKPESELKQAA